MQQADWILIAVGAVVFAASLFAVLGAFISTKASSETGVTAKIDGLEQRARDGDGEAQ